MTDREQIPDHILECIENLKNQIDDNILERASLDVALEAIVKHLPVYLKVVKSHIEQLSRVLNTEHHNHKTLENTELAQPVRQLMAIFRELNDDDLVTLEQLSSLSKIYSAEAHQQPEEVSQSQNQLSI